MMNSGFNMFKLVARNCPQCTVHTDHTELHTSELCHVSPPPTSPLPGPRIPSTLEKPSLNGINKKHCSAAETAVISLRDLITKTALRRKVGGGRGGGA